MDSQHELHKIVHKWQQYKDIATKNWYLGYDTINKLQIINNILKYWKYLA